VLTFFFVSFFFFFFFFFFLLYYLAQIPTLVAPCSIFHILGTKNYSN